MLLRRLAATSTLLVVAGCSSNAGTIERIDTTTPSDPSDTPSSTTTNTGDAVDGALTLNDPVLPTHGNGGYDVEHYDVTIDATDIAGSGLIAATVGIDLTAAAPLRSFGLDFVGYDITAVTVDGEEAPHTRVDTKLVISPSAPLTGSHRVEVTYSGVPTPIEDVSSPGEMGWLTAGAGSYLVSEPGGLMSVIPCNDHPSDPATFSFTITAAAGVTVATSGTARADFPQPAATGTTLNPTDGATTWSFELASSVPTYTAQIAIGDYDVITGEVQIADATVPIRHVVPRTMTDEQRSALHVTEEQVRFFADLLGFYPDDTYGILAANAPAEFALETSTLSMIPFEWFVSPNAMSVNEVTAHELAHQWFGNRVTLANWSELWLNEGFATYASWLWLEHAGYGTVTEYATDARQSVAGLRRRYGPVRQPTAATLWTDNQYTGAAVVLADLHERLGDAAFFELFQKWAAKDSPAASTTEEFVALASEIAGTDLAPLLDTWLNTTEVPADTGD